MVRSSGGDCSPLLRSPREPAFLAALHVGPGRVSMNIHRSIALVAVAALALASGATDAADKLDGAWIAVSAERNGKPADELKGHRLTFAGDTFVIERDGKTLYKGT